MQNNLTCGIITKFNINNIQPTSYVYKFMQNKYHPNKKVYKNVKKLNLLKPKFITFIRTGTVLDLSINNGV